MTVKALGPYDFPSADRKENFGDDQLVHVYWRGNLLLSAAACFRAPSAMTWADFRTQMVDPWAASDPEYDPAGAGDWRLFDEPFQPRDDATLAELGIEHKGLVTFATD